MKKLLFILLICGCGATLELQEDECCKTHAYHQRPVLYNWWKPIKPARQNYVIINNYKPNKPNNHRGEGKPGKNKKRKPRNNE